MTHVQAAPNTHPIGVHGACFRDVYHKDCGLSFINIVPIPLEHQNLEPKKVLMLL